MGHASAETTWKHYAHPFEEARLASSSDPEEAIWAARQAVLAERDVYQMFTERPRRRPRLVS
jgi:hypothetical protein